jgi:hypothetical protein
MVRWWTNWKGFGRKRPWPNRGSILEFAWRDWGKPWKSVKKAGDPAEIRTERLPNTRLELYRCANPLGYKLNKIKTCSSALKTLFKDGWFFSYSTTFPIRKRNCVGWYYLKLYRKLSRSVLTNHLRVFLTGLKETTKPSVRIFCLQEPFEYKCQ